MGCPLSLQGWEQGARRGKVPTLMPSAQPLPTKQPPAPHVPPPQTCRPAPLQLHPWRLTTRQPP